MIGLTFLGAALLWAFAVWWLCKRIPVWLSVKKHAVWLSWILFPILASLPFADHIIGMWQFDKLCAEQTRLQIYPSAANTKRGKGISEPLVDLPGYVIKISLRKNEIVDASTKETIARYNYFTTRGGWIGPTIMLGGQYTCDVASGGHPDQKSFDELNKRIDLTYGEKE